MTVYTCVIAGMLAWRDSYFSFLPWLILTLGLFIAHGTNNLLNDYTDFSRGVDKDNYFRTQYGVHPLVQGFWDKPTQLRWFMISGVIAFLSGVYALFYSHFDPLVIGLFAFGALVLLIYTYPLKYLGLGELAIFLIWGPIMVVGVYAVLAQGVVENVLVYRPGRRALWPERGQHQRRQAYRQIERRQAQGRGHSAGAHRRESRPLRQYRRPAADLPGVGLPGLHPPIFHTRDADHFLCHQAPDPGHKNPLQASPGRSPTRLPLLAHLVLRLQLQPQPFVRRLVYPGFDH